VWFVDTILNLLTHRSATIRRASGLILVLIIYYTGSFFIFLTTAGTTSVIVPTALELEDAAVAAYIPTPATPEQHRVYLKLLELVESRKSAFPAHVFTERALWSDSARVVGVTAVLLHWKRRKGLQLVINHISRYPFIREIIVWNNRVGVDLTNEVR
jgi:hypothetical protein